MSECCEWPWARSPKGYGVHRKGFVHRVVWEAFRGPIPEGSIIMHTCDNPPCYRLDHLVMGTPYDNTRDMLVKNRQSVQWYSETCARGHNDWGRHKNGSRFCRQCRNDRRRERRLRKKEGEKK